MGTVIGGLYLPRFDVADRGQAMNRGIAGAGQQIQNQTHLLELTELQRAQQAAEEARQWQMQHPEESLYGWRPEAPGSYLGGAGLPDAPMMQQTVGGGMPPGAPHVVPPGQDLSRFATQGAPGQGMAPPGQGPPHDPALELMRRNPDAARIVQERLAKMQDTRLERTIRETEYIGRILQGVEDEATYQPAKAEIYRALPQLAGKLPPTYSKAGIKPFQDRALAVGERAKWDLDVARTLKTTAEANIIPRIAHAIEAEGAAPPSAAPVAHGPALAPAPARPIAAPAAFEPVIADAVKRYPHVKPERIKSMIAAESNFDPNAVSPVGAQGLMQLMPGTAQEMGVTNPLNPEENVHGGTRYYAQMLTRYGGDERKALTAYNWGPGNLDTVGGDVSKAPPETQAYVAKVLGGGGARTAQPQASNPRIAELDRLIGQKEKIAQLVALSGNEASATQFHHNVTRLVDERKRLLDEDRRLQEREAEIPQAVAKETALQPLKLAQQKAGAEVQLEAKMNEPIGLDAGRKMSLPAQTKWKDVPPGTRTLEDPNATQIKAFGDLNSAAKGIKRMQGYMQNPEVTKMIGTLFTAPEAAFNRLVGDWISTLSPEQRKFAATVAREIAGLRHDMIGAGQSGIEMASLQPFLPTPADVDPDTLNAKLEALYEGILDKHDAHRENLDQFNIRGPKALSRPQERATTRSVRPIGPMELPEARAERDRLQALEKGGK